MRMILTVLVGLAMLGVLATLFAGMVGLVRGDGDGHRSNRLMRWRVILQFTTIVLFLALLLVMRN